MVAEPREPRRAHLGLVPAPARRARVYLRVSTEEQERKFGLTRQRRSCFDLVEEHGFAFDEARDVYEDTFTGTRLEEREAIQRLLRDAADGAFDVLVLDEYSRLSRRLHHQGAIITELERCGVEVISVKEGAANGANPAAIILRGVMGGIAEWERETIKVRCAEGNHERTMQGKPTCRRKAAFGLAWDDPAPGKKEFYVLNEDEVWVVREIFLAVAGLLFSLKGVAEDLTRRGVPCPEQKADEPLKPWSPAQVRQIVRNPIYTGKVYANRYVQVPSKTRGKKSRRERPRDEWIELARPDGRPIAPAAIPPELWEAANAVLDHNRESATRRNKDPEAALLRAGHVFCGLCGSQLNAQNNSRFGPQYAHDRSTAKNHGCPMQTITAATIDGPIWALVEAIIADPRLIEERLGQQRATDPYAEALRVNEQRLAKVLVEQKQHTAALVYVADNPVAAEPIALRLKSIAAEVTALDEDRKRMLADRAAWQADQSRVQTLMSLMRRLKRRLARISYADKRAILYALGLRAKVWPKEAGRADRWEVWLRLHPAAVEQVCYSAGEVDALIAESSPTRSFRNAPAALVLGWTAREVAALVAPLDAAVNMVGEGGCRR